MISGKSFPLSEPRFAHLSIESSSAPVPLGFALKIPELVYDAALGKVPGTRPPKCVLRVNPHLSAVYLLLLILELPVHLGHPEGLSQGLPATGILSVSGSWLQEQEFVMDPALETSTQWGPDS